MICGTSPTVREVLSDEHQRESSSQRSELLIRRGPCMWQKLRGLRAAISGCLFVLWISCASCAALEQQTAWPSPDTTPSATPTVSPSPTPAPASDDHYLRDGLRGIAEDSKTLTGWGLALIGASVV